MRRREFLASGALAAGALLVPGGLREALAAPARAGASPYGPLGGPDANGLMLPQGFRSRQIARGLQPVPTQPGSSYMFPVFPDGQATFRSGDGGWILVTNSESLSATGAGTSAVRFGPDGVVRAAYRILGDTNVNCAGGPTPWGTWLSGEEMDSGLIWECDPAGVLRAEPRPALGVFSHEAAAVDPVAGKLYLTEDKPDGRFYRFTPRAYPSLDDGLLEAAVVAPDGTVSWREVPDPTTAETSKPTRGQVPESTPFKGGEGIWYARGILYFTTKGDKKVWAYDARAGRIEVIYDREAAKDSSLDAVDNVTVTAAGDVFVCEDGGNQELGLISGPASAREVAPFLRFAGADFEASEVCGVCFDPSGTRLYVTSQRAFPLAPGQPGPGGVFEVSGPFRLPPSGQSEDFVFGPPAGEVRPNGPLNPGPDGAGPKLTVGSRRRIPRRTLATKELRVRVRVDEAAEVSVAYRSADILRAPGLGGSTPRPKTVTLARTSARFDRGGEVIARLRLGRTARLRLRRRTRPVRARLLVVARDGAGNRSSVVQTIVIGRAPGGRRRGRRRA
ncbi:MAG: DUF839 domain-containing protein [Thermoleophilaceae bacterium]|nr:DUF839 domain-containing protein [Thermoleophilaceae bacterium]